MSSSDDISSVPLKRRRSSILKRMSVAPDVISNSNEFARKKYISEATQETQEWIDLAKQRRREAKLAEEVFAQVSEQPPVFTFEDIKDDLKPEDLEFLLKRPNFNKMVKETDNFIENVALLKTKFEKVNSIVNNSEFLAKCRVKSIASNICLYNDLAPLKENNIM